MSKYTVDDEMQLPEWQPGRRANAACREHRSDTIYENISFSSACRASDVKGGGRRTLSLCACLNRSHYQFSSNNSNDKADVECVRTLRKNCHELFYPVEISASNNGLFRLAEVMQ